MEIRRDFYLDKLIKRKNNGLIKVITGIRRCGKSYLLNNLFYHHLLESGVDADHIIRFAFDSADDLYLIGESLIQIEKEKHGVAPEKFMTIYSGDKYMGLSEYMLYGGIPLVVLREGANDKAVALQNLFNEMSDYSIISCK